MRGEAKARTRQSEQRGGLKGCRCCRSAGTLAGSWVPRQTSCAARAGWKRSPGNDGKRGGVQQDASCGGSPEELAGYRGVCKVVDETAREGQLGRAGQGRGGYFCVV